MRILSLILVAALAASPALAEDRKPVISVTGEGSIEAPPDMATISLGVTTTGNTASEALDANSAALAAVLAEIIGPTVIQFCWPVAACVVGPSTVRAMTLVPIPPKTPPLLPTWRPRFTGDSASIPEPKSTTSPAARGDSQME